MMPPSRRDFLKLTIAAGSGLALAGPFQAFRATPRAVAAAGYGTPVPTPDQVRNHEVRPVGPALGRLDHAYDVNGGGSTTTITFDPRDPGNVESFLSLGGTSTNCAGGGTPWRSWLTCEETVIGPWGATPSAAQDHGYVFEVPSWTQRSVPAVPLTALGRFEARCSAGSRARTGASSTGRCTSPRRTAATRMPVRCGPSGPDTATLTLIYESPGPTSLLKPDNVVISPGGGILLCEDPDRAKQAYLRGLSGDGVIYDFAVNNRPGVIPASTTPASRDEFAGATFSPDGQWLFVNIQTPGITFAITGPWEKGPLGDPPVEDPA